MTWRCRCGHRWGRRRVWRPSAGRFPETLPGAGARAGQADRYAGEGGMSSESVPGPDSRVRLVLWRHGQTPWNIQGRFQGQTDIQLDEVGVEQAERAARLLAPLRPDALLASELG